MSISLPMRVPVVLAACIALLHPASSLAQHPRWGASPRHLQRSPHLPAHPASILGCALSADVAGVASCVLARAEKAGRRLAAMDAQAWARMSLVAACVQGAADAHLDPGLLLAIALMESGSDRYARNPDSTALGPFQFTEGAWLAAVRRYGGRYGLSAATAAQQAGGRRAASAHDATAGLLLMRTDPFLSAKLAAASLASDRAVLSASLGRAPTQVEMYLLHLLGEPSAARFIAAAGLDDGTSSDEVVPVAVASNQALFVREGGTLSPLEVSGSLDARMQQQLAVANAMIGAGPVSPPSAAAAARPGPRAASVRPWALRRRIPSRT